MAEELKIGDVVVHRAVTSSNYKIQMTVHSLTNKQSDASTNLEESDWVFCQWFNTQNYGYEKTAFNVNELQKIS